ncbi:MAG: HAMP domain-containing histidine kinase [Chloroflexi bacterium]|nr:HAMP domain-containing histidine kinase [Chloroflexota bacterium]
MLVSLDLRVTLFALTTGWAISLVLAVWLCKHLSRRAKALLPDPVDMQLAIERAPFGLMVLGPNNLCRYSNPSAQRMLGLAVYPCVLPNVDWTVLLEEDRVALRREHIGTGRFRNSPNGTAQVIRWWVTACGEADLVFLLDTESSLRTEQPSNNLLNDLSHELRTPLATILTHMEVLRPPEVAEETRRQSVDLILQELKRMTRLVHNLLELGHLDTGSGIERRPVEILALAQDVVTQVMAQATERGIGVDLQVDTPLPFVIGDADRLRQVFLNLLDNAIKYSRAGDNVRFTLNPDSASRSVICEIRDTGPGIPAEHLPKITRRFYRVASEEIAGSGLGLALVSEILMHHGSKLEIISQSEGADTGTRVRFALPAISEKEGN